MTLVFSQYDRSKQRQLLFLLPLILMLHAGSAAATEGSLKFAGVAFSPGSTVKANVPLSAPEKSFAAQGGNTVPPNAVAVIATPATFDPRKNWPVLLCVPPAISNVRIAMTLSIFIAESDLLKAGSF